MTIRSIIDRIDDVKENRFTTEEKILWLSELDGRIHREVVENCEGAFEWEPYDPEDSDTMDRELIADDNFASMYLSYLASKIDYFNGEYQRFNATAMMFNSEYIEFSNTYTREHMPLQRCRTIAR